MVLEWWASQLGGPAGGLAVNACGLDWWFGCEGGGAW